MSKAVEISTAESTQAISRATLLLLVAMLQQDAVS